MGTATLAQRQVDTDSYSPLYSTSSPNYLTRQLISDLGFRRFDLADIDYVLLVTMLKERSMPRDELEQARDMLYSLRAEAAKTGLRDVAKATVYYAKDLVGMMHTDVQLSYEPEDHAVGSSLRTIRKVTATVISKLNWHELNLPVIKALLGEINSQGSDYVETVSPDAIARAYEIICRNGDGFEPHALARIFISLDANPSKLEMLLRAQEADTTVH